MTPLANRSIAPDPETQGTLATGPTGVIHRGPGPSRSARTAAAWSPTDRWAWAYGLPVSGIARAVAGCIAYHANNKTGQGWPGIGTIVSETGFKRTAVIAAIQELERGGHLTVTREKVGGKNKVNRYQLPPMGSPPDGPGEVGGSPPDGPGSPPDGLGGSPLDGPESVRSESVQESVKAAAAATTSVRTEVQQPPVQPPAPPLPPLSNNSDEQPQKPDKPRKTHLPNLQKHLARSLRNNLLSMPTAHSLGNTTTGATETQPRVRATTTTSHRHHQAGSRHQTASAKATTRARHPRAGGGETEVHRRTSSVATTTSHSMTDTLRARLFCCTYAMQGAPLPRPGVLTCPLWVTMAGCSWSAVDTQGTTLAP